MLLFGACSPEFESVSGIQTKLKKTLAKFKNAPYETMRPKSIVSQPNPLLFLKGFIPTPSTNQLEIL